MMHRFINPRVYESMKKPTIAQELTFIFSQYMMDTLMHYPVETQPSQNTFYYGYLVATGLFPRRRQR